MKTLLFTLFLLSMPSAAFAESEGGDQGSGGDAVQCGNMMFAYDFAEMAWGQGKNLHDVDLRFVKLGHRDYFIFTDDLLTWTKLEDKTPLQAGLELVYEKLNNVFPAMAYDFKEFMELNEEVYDKSKNYVWKPSLSPLANIPDEASVHAVEGWQGPYCYTMSGGDSPKLFQAVRRKKTGRKVEFNKHIGTMDALAETGVLQLTFTYVHEFLQNYTDDRDDIRELNWLIHSAEFEQLDQEAIADHFRGKLERIFGAKDNPHKLFDNPEKAAKKLKWLEEKRLRDIEENRQQNALRRYIHRICKHTKDSEFSGPAAHIDFLENQIINIESVISSLRVYGISFTIFDQPEPIEINLDWNLRESTMQHDKRKRDLNSCLRKKRSKKRDLEKLIAAEQETATLATEN